MVSLLVISIISPGTVELKFLSGENFRQFHHLVMLAKILFREFFVLCQQSHRAYGDLYHIGKNFKSFCNTKVPGLGKIFVQRKFSAMQYIGILHVPLITVYMPLLYLGSQIVSPRASTTESQATL